MAGYSPVCDRDVTFWGPLFDEEEVKEGSPDELDDTSAKGAAEGGGVVRTKTLSLFEEWKESPDKERSLTSLKMRLNLLVSQEREIKASIACTRAEYTGISELFHFTDPRVKERKNEKVLLGYSQLRVCYQTQKELSITLMRIFEDKVVSIQQEVKTLDNIRTKNVNLIKRMQRIQRERDLLSYEADCLEKAMSKIDANLDEYRRRNKEQQRFDSIRNEYDEFTEMLDERLDTTKVEEAAFREKNVIKE